MKIAIGKTDLGDGVYVRNGLGVDGVVQRADEPEQGLEHRCSLEEIHLGLRHNFLLGNGVDARGGRCDGGHSGHSRRLVGHDTSSENTEEEIEDGQKTWLFKEAERRTKGTPPRPHPQPSARPVTEQG